MVQGVGKLYLPAKKHRAINRTLALPGATLCAQGEVFRKNGKWYVRCGVKVPVPEAPTGEVDWRRRGRKNEQLRDPGWVSGASPDPPLETCPCPVEPCGKSRALTNRGILVPRGNCSPEEARKQIVTVCSTNGKRHCS